MADPAGVKAALVLSVIISIGFFIAIISAIARGGKKWDIIQE